MPNKIMVFDVTKEVDFGNSDDEALPITKCVCGKEFTTWDFHISIYESDPTPCPECGRKFYFSNSIHVYEVKDTEEMSQNG